MNSWQFPSVSRGLFSCERDFIRRVELGVVIAGGDAELQGVLARLDAVQSSLDALEHARHLAVDVSMNMLADLALGQFELERHGIALDDLARFWGNNFDASTLSRLESRLRGHFFSLLGWHLHALHVVVALLRG